jgi:hypothetical protein
MAMHDLRPDDLKDEVTYATQCNDGCSDQCQPTSTKAIPYSKFPYPFEPTSYDPNDLNVCPFATTRIMRHKNSGVHAIFGVTCKRWNCGPCGRQKIRDLAWWTKLACPNKLLTLTVDPALHDNPELAWLATSPKVPELVRVIRKRFGKFEYLRVVEQTDKGWPHYHMMCRSDYVPQQIIKKTWDELTGAKIVDIREVKQFFNSFQYLVKYLTKLHHVDWTERHVTYSRGFFPVAITNEPSPQEWETIRTIDAHPLDYIGSNFNAGELLAVGPLRFETRDEPPHWEKPIVPEKPKPEVQTNMFF